MYRPLLRWGSRGPDVKLLQQALNEAPSRLPKLVADGIFGGKTHARVGEFQRDRMLVADGVVGPNTHQSLDEFYQLITAIVDHIVPPGSESAARARIVATAESYHATLGWLPSGPLPPDPANPRIAGRYCCDPATRARQGGVAMASIFHIAGHPHATRCPTLSQEAEDMYHRRGKWAHRNFTPQERNNIDIVSWCGIFSLCVLKVSGLKMSPWPLRVKNLTKAGQAPELKAVAFDDVREGDLCNIEPWGGRNHFFVIIGRSGNQLTSVDGNAGDLQTILSRNYPVVGKVDSFVYNIQALGTERCVFLTPIWDQVL